MKFGAYVLIYLNAKLLDELIVFYVIKTHYPQNNFSFTGYRYVSPVLIHLSVRLFQFKKLEGH